MSRVDLVMQEFWDGIWSQQRRALAVFAYCDELAQRLADHYVPWGELSTDERMRIVRSLPHVGEFAAIAAAALARARKEELGKRAQR